jgi:hypothetical protein
MEIIYKHIRRKNTHPIIYIEMNIETNEGYTTFFVCFYKAEAKKDGI